MRGVVDVRDMCMPDRITPEAEVVM